MQNKEELQQNLANADKLQESKDLQEYVDISKKRLKALLKRLQWTEECVRRNFNSNSHAANNSEISKKYEMDPPLPVSCATRNSITIGEQQLRQLVKNPAATIPQKFSQLQQNFNREQKLRLYEHVVEHTEKYMEPELTVPIHCDGNSVTFAEIVTMKKREKKTKEKLRKYRTSKPTQIEEVRNLVELQMQALEQYIKPEVHHRSSSRDREYYKDRRKRSHSINGSTSRKRNISRGREKSKEQNYSKRKRSISVNKRYTSRDRIHHSNNQSRSRRCSEIRSRSPSHSRDKSYSRLETRQSSKQSQSIEKNKSKDVNNKEIYFHASARHKRYSERNEKSRSRGRSHASQHRTREIRERCNAARKETERSASRERSRSKNRIYSNEKYQSHSRHKAYKKKRSRSRTRNRKAEHRRRQSSSDAKERDKGHRRKRRSRSRNRKTSHRSRQKRSHRERSSQSSSTTNSTQNERKSSLNRSNNQIMSASHIKRELDDLNYNSNAIKVKCNEFENYAAIKEENVNFGYNGNGIKVEPTTNCSNY